MTWAHARTGGLLALHRRGWTPLGRGIGCRCPVGTVTLPPDDPDPDRARPDEYEPEPTYEVDLDPDFDPDYDPDYDPAADDDGGYPHAAP